MLKNIDLSVDESQALKQILNGDKTLYKNLYALDFWEIPVDVLTFVKHKDYIGRSTYSRERGAAGKIYSYWLDAFQEIFSSPKKCEIILSGPIGIGKSNLADLCLLYIDYYIHCLKNPHDYFDFIEGKKLLLFLFSIKKNLSESGHWGKLNEIMLKSPWFREIGRIRGTKDEWLEMPYTTFGVGSSFMKGLGQQGDDVIAGCWTADTVFKDTNNEEFRIGDKIGCYISIYNKDEDIVLSEVVKTGRKEMFEVRLENNKTFKASGDQRFLIENQETGRQCVRKLLDIDLEREYLLEKIEEAN